MSKQKHTDPTPAPKADSRDKHGQTLTVGDEVTICGKITEIEPAEDGHGVIAVSVVNPHGTPFSLTVDSCCVAKPCDIPGPPPNFEGMMAAAPATFPAKEAFAEAASRGVTDREMSTGIQQLAMMPPNQAATALIQQITANFPSFGTIIQILQVLSANAGNITAIVAALQKLWASLNTPPIPPVTPGGLPAA